MKHSFDTAHGQIFGESTNAAPIIRRAGSVGYRVGRGRQRFVARHARPWMWRLRDLFAAHDAARRGDRMSGKRTPAATASGAAICVALVALAYPLGGCRPEPSTHGPAPQAASRGGKRPVGDLTEEDCVQIAFRALTRLRTKPSDRIVLWGAVEDLESVAPVAFSVIDSALMDKSFPRRDLVAPFASAGPKTGAESALIFAAKSGDVALRIAALQELTEVGGDRSLPVLQACARSGIPAERAAALCALGFLSPRTASPLLMAGLEDSSARVRDSALKALSRLGDTKAGLAIKRLTKDPWPNVRFTAFLALARVLPRDRAVSNWFAGLRHAWPLYLQRDEKLRLISVCGGLKCPAAAWLPSAALGDGDSTIRRAMVEACSAYRTVDARMLETFMKREPDTNLKTEYAPQVWRRDPRAATPYVETLLQGNVPSNVPALLEDLGRSGHIEAVPILTRLLPGRWRFDAAVALSTLGVPASALRGVPEEADRTFSTMHMYDRMDFAAALARSASTASWIQAMRRRAQLDREQYVRLMVVRFHPRNPHRWDPGMN